MSRINNSNFLGVCQNCMYNDNCALKTSDTIPVNYCNEYSLTNQKGFLKTPDLSNSLDLQNNYEGLCKSCDHVSSCSLKSIDRYVLNCEHYQ